MRACIVCNGSIAGTPAKKFCSPDCYYQHHVIKTETCWGWTGRHRLHYGRIRAGTKTVSAHRFSYEKHVGPIPNSMWVLHKCDNPVCTNPEHLYLGTEIENGKDMSERKRNCASRNKGSKNPKALIDEIKAREIFLSAETGVKIAAQYGISRVLVSNIKRKKRWAHATP